MTSLKTYIGKSTVTVSAVLLMLVSAMLFLDSMGMIETNLEMVQGVIALGIGLVLLNESLFESRKTKMTNGVYLELLFSGIAILMGVGGLFNMPSLVSMFSGFETIIYGGWTVMLAYEIFVNRT